MDIEKKITAIVLASIMAMNSCSKDNSAISDSSNIVFLNIEQPVCETEVKTVLGTKENDFYPVYWSKGDAVVISGQTESTFATYSLQGDGGSTSGVFQLKSGTPPTTSVYAFYPSSDVVGVDGKYYSVKIPCEQKYTASSFGNGAMPMYASSASVGKMNSMKPLMSVLKLSLQGNCSVKSIMLSSSSLILSGTATVDMSTGNLSFNEEQGKKYVILTCDSALDVSIAKTIHIVVPPTSAKVDDLTVTIKDVKGHIMQKKLKTSTPFSTQVIKNVPSALQVKTSCILPGKFTVNNNGKQVRFTMGNLYRDNASSPNIWTFETHQYDFRTQSGKGSCINGVSSSSSGTPSNNKGIVCWSRTENNAAYYNYSDATDANDTPFFSEYIYGTTTKKCMTVEGQTGLFALSYQEWLYLSFQRIVNGGKGEGKSYRRVSIVTSDNSSVKGMLFFPDGYSGIIPSTNAEVSLNEWLSYESSGVLFLPASGSTGATGVMDVGESGYYWSSSSISTSSPRSAYYLGFTDDISVGVGNRDCAMSIRLVSVAQ